MGKFLACRIDFSQNFWSAKNFCISNFIFANTIIFFTNLVSSIPTQIYPQVTSVASVD
jgi:hypothetical protein